MVISLSIADSGLTSNILLEGKLTKRIKCDESLWSLMPGECVQLNLEKHQDIYWTAVLEDEPEIDRTKIDTTRDISEFDQQTQSDFQRVMYDHQQKLQGKPTSQEQVYYMHRKEFIKVGSCIYEMVIF